MPTPGNRPKNIVFIMADQLAARQIGCYGSGVDSTPTLDRLAADGTRFDRCYASSPVCTPNRATFLTGRSPVVHGLVSNNFNLIPDNPTYAQVLSQHGYHVGGFGKFHHTPMPLPHPEDYSHLGFDETVISEDPKWGPWVDWVRTEHPEHYDAALAVAWGDPPMHDGEQPTDERCTPEKLREIRQRILLPLHQQATWKACYESPLPAEVHQTTYLTDQGIDYISRRKEQAPDQPFFCFLSYVDPHAPYDPPKPYADMFRPEEMPEAVPAAWKEEGNALLEKVQDWIGFGKIANDPAGIAELRARFHGSLRLIDDNVARLLAFLDQQGLRDDTMIVFTTDHGEMLGDHQLSAKGVRPYDAGVRCPLIVAGPGVKPQVTDRLTCTLDFFPTFCDWAGIGADQLPPLEGKSFAPACAGEDDPGWADVQVAFGPTESVISDDGWRLTLFDHPDSPPQLIDLNNDPDEQVNLYNHPEHQDRLREMFERMVKQHIRVRTTPQFRNLPVWKGQKYEAGGAGNGNMVNPRPLYTDPTNFPTW